MKIYINKDGWVCQHAPYNLPIEDESQFVEVSPAEWEYLLKWEQGKNWRYIGNGKFELQIYNVDDYLQASQIKEYNELINWFNTYYTIHEQKYRRLHTLNKLTDEGENAYTMLLALYDEAEQKRARIQELEALIG